jgi:hypothetical protein
VREGKEECTINFMVYEYQFTSSTLLSYTCRNVEVKGPYVLLDSYSHIRWRSCPKVEYDHNDKLALENNENELHIKLSITITTLRFHIESIFMASNCMVQNNEQKTTLTIYNKLRR